MRYLYALLCVCMFIYACKNTPPKQVHGEEEDIALTLTPPRTDSTETNLDVLLKRIINYNALAILPDSALVTGIDLPDRFEDNGFIKADTFRKHTFTVLFYNNEDSNVYTVYLNGHRFIDSFNYFEDDRTDSYCSLTGLDLFDEYDLWYAFRFHEKTYYYFTGPVHMCNGSGCNYLHYFIYDESNHALNVTELGYLTSGRLLGDVNNDGRLDFVAIHAQGPYTDDTSGGYQYDISLYSMNDSGRFVLQKDADGKEYNISGRYTGWGIGDSTITIEKVNWPTPVDKSVIK